MNSSRKAKKNSESQVARKFHPGACFKCYATPNKSITLMRCSQCQLVSYCSKNCQRSDWSNHKSLCLANKIQEGKNIFSNARESLESDKDWLKLRTSLMMICHVNLKRKLHSHEKEIFLFPKVCNICKDSTVPSLTECEDCHSVFYCSVEHFEADQKDHIDWCHGFFLNLKCNASESQSGIQDLPFPCVVDNDYQKLPSSFEKLMNVQEFIEKDIGALEAQEDVKMALVSERLSYPLSLLFALEKVGVGTERKNVDQVEEMRVHVIGALSSKELLGIIRWEYFLHRLPSLQKVHFVFIGPELFTTFEVDDEEIPDKHCIDDSGMLRCEDCQKKNRVVVYEMAAMTYVEYAESEYFSQPDIIISYNCGFHEFLEEKNDTWKESLDLIINGENIPLIFTSYTESEAHLDLKALQKLGKFQVEISSLRNPFSSLRPHRDSCGEDCKLFFSNEYITSIRGKSLSV